MCIPREGMVACCDKSQRLLLYNEGHQNAATGRRCEVRRMLRLQQLAPG